MESIKFDFTDKKYVVTGATSGIGRQIACEIMQNGGTVLVIGRNTEELKKLSDEFGKNCVAKCVDVVEYDKVDTAIIEFVQEKGKIDGSVHAAGVMAMTPLRNFSMEQAKLIMEISFWAGVKLVQQVTRVQNSNIGSSHVLISSVSGIIGEKGKFAYSASKGALKVATQSLAKELASKKHRINTVSPGWVKTKLTNNEELSNHKDIMEKHLLGIGNPEDVSGIILFLLSDRARWITGTDIIVDGGYSIN